MGETQGQMLYLYNLAGPRAIIVAKLLYNCLLMAGISLVTLLFYVLLSAGDALVRPVQYGVAVLIGGWTFAGHLTLVSGIAARAQDKSTLLAVLSSRLFVPRCW